MTDTKLRRLHGNKLNSQTNRTVARQLASWPINPDFPKEFQFPDFASTEWLASALWETTKGDTGRIRTEGTHFGNALSWQAVWEDIYYKNGAGTESTMTNTVDLTHYRLPNAGDWAQTLLDPDALWRDINSWALHAQQTRT